MRLQQALRLFRAVAQREFRGHPEWIKGVDVAACGQDVRAADQIAARHGGDEPPAERAQQGGNFTVLRQFGGIVGPLFGVVAGQDVQVACHRSRIGPPAQHMQPVRDQRVFGFQQLDPQRRRGDTAQINGCRLFGNQTLQLGQFRRVRIGGAPALQAVLQLQQSLVKPGLRQRRGQVRHGDRVRAALGQRGFRRVVGGIKVDIGQPADQPVGPAARPHARLLARHEFQRAMHAEMQQGIGPEILAQPAVKGGEGMGRGKALLEQKAHRVAFIAEDRLNADHHLAELRAQHEDAAPIGLNASGRRSPGGLDLGQPGGAGHDIVRADMGGHIGGLAELGGIALQNCRAQILDCGGRGHVIAFGSHGLQRVVQRFED